MDSHLRSIEELTAIRDSGIRYSIQNVANRLLIRLGEPEDEPTAMAIVEDFEQAVSWLREQVKVHYPRSAYARRLLTN